MATQAQIQVLIDQIVPNANYRANQMNPLLTDILTAAYGPMYIDAFPPTVNDDETGGYRPGSVAYDTASKRIYICKVATAGAADWVLIPADANYEYKLYSSAGDGMTLFPNTSVFKADNNSLAINIGCYVNLPANPYRGKVVILYLQNSIDLFDIRDSLGIPIFAGASLTIIGGDQYTIVYNGAIWEIIGIANINPATLSGVAVSKGATNIPNTTFLNFIGSSVTVTPSGSGADVTINPASGVDVKRGTTTIKYAAQFIGFNAYFFDVDVNGTGADVTFVQRITAQKNAANVNTFATGFDFAGSLFDTVSMVGTIATVTMNGAKTLTLTGFLAPTVTNDSSAGYSRGSIAVNTGTTLRKFICTDNTIGAANWVRLTEDNGYEALPLSSSGASSLLPNTANVAYPLAAPLVSAVINLPPYAYVGKKVFVSFQSNVGTLPSTGGVQFRNSIGVGQFTAIISGASSTIPKMIIAVCVNEITQSWVRLQ
jgi:hypothetical protein